MSTHFVRKPALHHWLPGLGVLCVVASFLRTRGDVCYTSNCCVSTYWWGSLHRTCGYLALMWVVSSSLLHSWWRGEKACIALIVTCVIVCFVVIRISSRSWWCMCNTITGQWHVHHISIYQPWVSCHFVSLHIVVCVSYSGVTCFQLHAMLCTVTIHGDVCYTADAPVHTCEEFCIVQVIDYLAWVTHWFVWLRCLYSLMVMPVLCYYCVSIDTRWSLLHTSSYLSVTCHAVCCDWVCACSWWSLFRILSRHAPCCVLISHFYRHMMGFVLYK